MKILKKIFIIIQNKKFYQKLNFIQFIGRLKNMLKINFWHP